MKLPFKFKSLFAMLISLCLINSCKSYRYTGSKEFETKNDISCLVEVKSSPPTNLRYISLGTCQSNGIGFIGNGSDAAMNSLKRCACKFGGDAIILTSSFEKTVTYQNSFRLQRSLSMQAEVIKYRD